MVKGFGLERRGFPGIAAVASLAVGAKQAGMHSRLLVAGRTLRLGLVVAVVGVALVTRNLAVLACQDKAGHVMVKALNGFGGWVKAASLVLGMAAGALVNFLQAPVQALLALNLGGNIGMAVHTQHSLVILQRLVAQGAVIFKVSVRAVVLHDHSWQAFGADWTGRKTDPAKQPGNNSKCNNKYNRNGNTDRRKEGR